MPHERRGCFKDLGPGIWDLAELISCFDKAVDDSRQIPRFLGMTKTLVPQRLAVL